MASERDSERETQRETQRERERERERDRDRDRARESIAFDMQLIAHRCLTHLSLTIQSTASSSAVIQSIKASLTHLPLTIQSTASSGLDELLCSSRPLGPLYKNVVQSR